MLTRMARFITRSPRAVLTAALAIAVLCGVFGATAPAHLKSGGFTSDDAESARVAQLISDNFAGAAPNFVLLVSSDAGADDPATKAAGAGLADALKSRTDVQGVQSYWTTPQPLANALRSTDGKSALVVAFIDGDETQVQQTASELERQFAGVSNGITVRQGGIAAIYQDVTEQTTRDLALAEGVAVPLSMIVLILVFGSLVAASLPLAIGVFAILATLALLRMFTLFTDVSIYALNMTTAMGLALAIDSSLFIVSRFREELANGLDPAAATIRSVQTAGRTVLFSALTVALSMAVLSVFDLYFLKSFAYAGVAVVAAAALASIVVLPAALVLLGHRVNSLDLRAPLRRLFGRDAPAPGPQRPEDTGWYRLAGVVMRHAAPVAVAIIALLLALGAPFLSVKFGYPDDRVLPDSAASRQVGDALRTEFPQADPVASTTIVLDGYRGGSAALGGYAAELSKVEGVPAVLSAAGVYVTGARVAPPPPGMINDTGTYLSVATKLDPFSPAGDRQLKAIRTIPAPGDALYGGAAAANADSLQALAARLPLAAALIALTTFVVLFLFTGSVVLPIKALVLNTLSLAAAFGAMVWVFQEGHLSGLLGFTAVGYLVPTMPILMFCLAFGLSMDYEVFLLSRVREEWLATHDNTRAVAIGLARTGRIFTAAAVLMAIVLGALVTAKVSFMQLLGLGLTLTVLADATLIRGLLAPALMRLLGPANWWAPAPLARLHAKIGLTEGEEDAAARPLETAGRA
ncbi:MMPL family transporter [Nocardia araoensis]|uniref:MMPL family transporter n=1 Tax=Nocardia araoensis TaxID=228600 RepID=UPI0002D65095|nr:MMPL family transporter [Nocardia araoensis]